MSVGVTGLYTVLFAQISILSFCTFKSLQVPEPEIAGKLDRCFMFLYLLSTLQYQSTYWHEHNGVKLHNDLAALSYIPSFFNYLFVD